MNEIVNEKFNEFCEKQKIDISSIDPDVVVSCSLVTEILNENDVNLSIIRAQNDIIFSVESLDYSSIISRLFAEATLNVKCYDIYNTGRGVKIIFTYENAIK